MKKTLLLLSALALTASLLFATPITYTGDFQFGYKTSFKDGIDVSPLSKAEVAMDAKLSFSYGTITLSTVNGNNSRNIDANLSFRLSKAIEFAHNIELPVDLTLGLGGTQAVETVSAYKSYFGGKSDILMVSKTNTDAVSLQGIVGGWLFNISGSPITDGTDLAASFKFIPKKGLELSAAWVLNGAYYNANNKYAKLKDGAVAAAVSFDAQKFLATDFEAVASVADVYCLGENINQLSASLALGFGKFDLYAESLVVTKPAADAAWALSSKAVYNQDGLFYPALYMSVSDKEESLTLGASASLKLQTLTLSCSLDWNKSAGLTSTSKVKMSF